MFCVCKQHPPMPLKSDDNLFFLLVFEEDEDFLDLRFFLNIDLIFVKLKSFIFDDCGCDVEDRLDGYGMEAFAASFGSTTVPVVVVANDDCIDDMERKCRTGKKV